MHRHAAVGAFRLSSPTQSASEASNHTSSASRDSSTSPTVVLLVRGAAAEADADGYDSEGGSPGADRAASEPLPVRSAFAFVLCIEVLAGYAFGTQASEGRRGAGQASAVKPLHSALRTCSCVW